MAHWSSCAVHNAPALPVGPCDCGNDAPEGHISYERFDFAKGTVEVREREIDARQVLAGNALFQQIAREKLGVTQNMPNG